jgi:hypothetical protein
MEIEKEVLHGATSPMRHFVYVLVPDVPGPGES